MAVEELRADELSTEEKPPRATKTVVGENTTVSYF